MELLLVQTNLPRMSNNVPGGINPRTNLLRKREASLRGLRNIFKIGYAVLHRDTKILVLDNGVRVQLAHVLNALLGSGGGPKTAWACRITSGEGGLLIA